MADKKQAEPKQVIKASEGFVRMSDALEVIEVAAQGNDGDYSPRKKEEKQEK